MPLIVPRIQQYAMIISDPNNTPIVVCGPYATSDLANRDLMAAQYSDIYAGCTFYVTPYVADVQQLLQA